MNQMIFRTDLSAGCVQLRMRSAEPPGEHCYENLNNNKSKFFHV